MQLNIHNAQPLITADPRIAGAAVKIVLAGGASLSEDAAHRATGISYFVWKRGDIARQVLDLVHELEPEAPLAA